MPEIHEILQGAKAEDLKVDRLGRVVIANPALAKQLGEVAQIAPAVEELAGNGLCCGNTGCASPELVSLLDRLVSGRTVTRGGQ